MMRTVQLSCPDCTGPMIPKIVLRRWDRKQQLQCLACGEVWTATTLPDTSGEIVNQWQAELKRYAAEHPEPFIQ